MYFMNNCHKPLSPNFVTGLVDAEGSFIISIYINRKLKTGWRVIPIFQIGLHNKDRAFLEQIKSSLGVGQIYKQGKDMNQLRVFSMNELGQIIDHFENYPLITQKWADYELFKQAVEMINRKEHLTEEGLKKIVAIKASMNNGLSSGFKSAFPSIIPVPRPVVEGQEIKDPHWLAGFTTGEGCFNINITKSSTNKAGFQVQLKFQITQHIRDAELLKSLVSYLSCGYYYASKGRDCGDFLAIRFPDQVRSSHSSRNTLYKVLKQMISLTSVKLPN